MDINKKLLEIYKSHHLPSLSKFIKYVRNELDKTLYPITINKIKEWYDNQKINQIKSTKNKVYYKTPIRGIDKPGYEIQMDLIDISKLYHSNSYNKFILMIMDLYSRYIWAYPLKNKSPDSVLPEFKLFQQDLLEKGYIVKSVTTDDGNEFKGDKLSLIVGNHPGNWKGEHVEINVVDRNC